MRKGGDTFPLINPQFHSLENHEDRFEVWGAGRRKLKREVPQKGGGRQLNRIHLLRRDAVGAGKAFLISEGRRFFSRVTLAQSSRIE